MISALIIEDTPSCQDNLKGLLEIYCPEIKLLGIGATVDEGLQLINKHRADLVFLDVELEDKTSFDLLNQVKTIDFNIVFVTAFEHYSLKAIKYSAIDYVVKPINPDQLLNAVEKTKNSLHISILQKQVEILMQQSSALDKIALPSTTGLIFTKIENIIHCKSEGDHTIMSLKDHKDDVLITRSLGDLEQLLPSKDFFRTHNSHLINKIFLKEYISRDGGYVLLDNGANVPVAWNRKDAFLESIK